MKKKEESEKRERKKEVVCAAVATITRQISTLISGVRKNEISKSCLWTRCSTKEYVARNYTKTEVWKSESRISLPCLWTLPVSNFENSLSTTCRNRIEADRSFASFWVGVWPQTFSHNMNFPIEIHFHHIQQYTTAGNLLYTSSEGTNRAKFRKSTAKTNLCSS